MWSATRFPLCSVRMCLLQWMHFCILLEVKKKRMSRQAAFQNHLTKALLVLPVCLSKMQSTKVKEAELSERRLQDVEEKEGTEA